MPLPHWFVVVVVVLTGVEVVDVVVLGGACVVVVVGAGSHMQVIGEQISPSGHMNAPSGEFGSHSSPGST